MDNIELKPQQRFSNIKNGTASIYLPVYRLVGLMELISIFDQSFECYTDLVRENGKHQVINKG